MASGKFVWPTQGTITQRFAWYHPGIDIANKSTPIDVAADSGKVIFAGWDATGYGNMVMIDHGNGFKTRYGHLSKFAVTPDPGVIEVNTRQSASDGVHWDRYPFKTYAKSFWEGFRWPFGPRS